MNENIQKIRKDNDTPSRIGEIVVVLTQPNVWTVSMDSTFL